MLRSFAVVGVDPDIMGVGPADAIPGTHSPANISNSFIYRPSLVTWLLVNCWLAAIRQAGLSKEDIGLYEINEAFASQATYCIQKLNISPDVVIGEAPLHQ